MTKTQIIKKTEKFVQSKLYGEGSGHDWWHTWRVWQMAKKIAAQEKADLFVVELAALLHDIADWKFQKNYDDSVGAIVTKEWLEKLGVDAETINRVCKIVTGISFKGAGVKDKLDTIAGKVVQDADRLDAIGAVGIARCFTYGGSIGRQIYDPNLKIQAHKSFKAYRINQKQGSSVNHFYEKLLLLKDRVNTKTGKKLAAKRHKLMESFLDRFFGEWNGEM